MDKNLEMSGKKKIGLGILALVLFSALIGAKEMDYPILVYITTVPLLAAIGCVFMGKFREYTSWIVLVSIVVLAAIIGYNAMQDLDADKATDSQEIIENSK